MPDRRYGVVGGLIRHLFNDYGYNSGSERVTEALPLLTPALILKFNFGRLNAIDMYPTLYHSLFHCTRVQVVGSRLMKMSVDAASNTVASQMSSIMQFDSGFDRDVASFRGTDGTMFEHSFFRSLDPSPSRKLNFCQVVACTFVPNPKNPSKKQKKRAPFSSLNPPVSLVSSEYELDFLPFLLSHL